MASDYERRSAKRAAEIIVEHKAIEGATLVIPHASQAAFGHVPKSSVLMMAEALNSSREWRDEQWQP